MSFIKFSSPAVINCCILFNPMFKIKSFESYVSFKFVAVHSCCVVSYKALTNLFRSFPKGIKQISYSEKKNTRLSIQLVGVNLLLPI
jgi:hypothetical protein